MKFPKSAEWRVPSALSAAAAAAIAAFTAARVTTCLGRKMPRRHSCAMGENVQIEWLASKNSHPPIRFSEKLCEEKCCAGVKKGVF